MAHSKQTLFVIRQPDIYGFVQDGSINLSGTAKFQQIFSNESILIGDKNTLGYEIYVDSDSQLIVKKWVSGVESGLSVIMGGL